MFFPFPLSPFIPFPSATDGKDGSASPFSAFEVWSDAVMAPWMAWMHGSPWAFPPILAGEGSPPWGGPMAVTPMGIIAVLEQAYTTANRTVEALGQAMAETHGGPVLVDITDTSGPFSIRVAVSLKGRGGSLSEGPVIDHDSAAGTLPST